VPAGAFRRVAVAIDGSPAAEQALGTAIEVAGRFSAELLVIAIVPLPAVYVAPNAPFVPTTVPGNLVDRFRELVDAAVSKARAAGVASVRGVCEEGPVVEGILARVRSEGSDLLVVGSRGLSAAERLLLGSVSTGVVTHAPCPVLVVRPVTPPTASG